MADQFAAGDMPLSGAMTPRKLEPAALARAEQRLAGLGGRVWANARYENNAVKVRVSVAIPYSDLDDRAATHSIELTEADGTPFESAFQALIEAAMPRLLREGRRAAAMCLLSAEAAGEMEV